MMKCRCHHISAWFGAILVLVGLCAFARMVYAADAVGDWRSTYDLVMRWINFAILVFIILRYGRKPLANFFRGKSLEVKEGIEEIEAEKENLEIKIRGLLKQREKSRERLDKLKARIISQAKAKKQKIIDDAHQESKLLLEGARQKIDHQIAKAADGLRAEMIDAAISLAMDRLPDHITDQDNQEFLQMYLEI